MLKFPTCNFHLQIIILESRYIDVAFIVGNLRNVLSINKRNP